MREGKRNFAMLASAVAGVSLGWLAVDYLSKRQEQGEDKSVFERVKNFEEKLYADGAMRANDIERIKQEVNDKIVK